MGDEQNGLCVCATEHHQQNCCTSVAMLRTFDFPRTVCWLACARERIYSSLVQPFNTLVSLVFALLRYVTIAIGFAFVLGLHPFIESYSYFYRVLVSYFQSTTAHSLASLSFIAFNDTTTLLHQICALPVRALTLLIILSLRVPFYKHNTHTYTVVPSASCWLHWGGSSEEF